MCGDSYFARHSVSYCTVYVWDSYFHRAECAALYSFYVGILIFARHSVSYCTVYVWGFLPSPGTVSRIVHFMCGILTFTPGWWRYCTVYVWGLLPSLGTVSRIVQFMCGDSYFHRAECAALYSFYVGILTFERHSVSYCTVYVWGFSPSLGTVSRIVHFMCGDSYPSLPGGGGIVQFMCGDSYLR